jgi:hypothetical protein
VVRNFPPIYHLKRPFSPDEKNYLIYRLALDEALNLHLVRGKKSPFGGCTVGVIREGLSNKG